MCLIICDQIIQKLYTTFNIVSSRKLSFATKVLKKSGEHSLPSLFEVFDDLTFAALSSDLFGWNLFSAEKVDHTIQYLTYFVY